MQYQFPEIYTIDDVYSHIRDRDEFVVAERDYGTVINYAVAFKDTFDMAGPDDLSGAMRRECRGIVFDLDGRIMSRPYHKFFNLNERDETSIENVDFTQNHRVYEKADGSMIRPLKVGGNIVFGTKMGYTEIGESVTKEFMTDQIANWLEYIMDYMKWTPLFEWVSPENRIVVDYPESKLVLTGVRHNVTGEYLIPEFFVKFSNCPFDFVKEYDPISNVDGFVDSVRNRENEEGVVIRFDNGHAVKLKNDWYVKIHKALDALGMGDTRERKTLKAVLNNEIDDILPYLTDTDKKVVENIEVNFEEDYHIKLEYLENLCYKASKMESNKQVALELVPTIKSKKDVKIVFDYLKGIPVKESLMKTVKDSTDNTTKYDEMRKWLCEV